MRLVLADDSALFRQGLAALLSQAGHEVVAQIGNARSLLDSVAALRPDVAIIDIRMPPTGTTEGLEAAALIRARQPEVGVLVLSQYIETSHAVNLLISSRNGVGYLLKDHVGEVAELTDVLERISAGETAIDPEVVALLMAHRSRSGRLDRLTERERSVLELMAQGRSNLAISRQLFLGVKTVETHVGNIFAKLEITLGADDNRRVLAVLAHLRG